MTQTVFKQDIFVGSKFIKVYKTNHDVELTFMDKKIMNPAGIIQMFSVPSSKYFYINEKGNLPYIGSDTGEQMYKDIKAWRIGGVGILYNPPTYSTQLDQGVNNLKGKLFRAQNVNIQTVADMVAIEYKNRYSIDDYYPVKKYVTENYELFIPFKHSIRTAADILRALYLVLNKATEYDIQEYLDNVGCITLTGKKLVLITAGYPQDLFFALTRFHLPPPGKMSPDLYFYARGYLAMSNNYRTQIMLNRILNNRDERVLDHLKEFDEMYTSAQIPIDSSYVKKYEAFSFRMMYSDPMFYITYKKSPNLPKLTEEVVKNRNRKTYPTIMSLLAVYPDNEIYDLLGEPKYIQEVTNIGNKLSTVKVLKFDPSSRTDLILKVSEHLLKKGII